MKNTPENERTYVSATLGRIAYYKTQGLYKGFWHIGKRNKNGQFYPLIICCTESFNSYYRA